MIRANFVAVDEPVASHGYGDERGKVCTVSCYTPKTSRVHFLHFHNIPYFKLAYVSSEDTRLLFPTPSAVETIHGRPWGKKKAAEPHPRRLKVDLIHMRASSRHQSGRCFLISKSQSRIAPSNFITNFNVPKGKVYLALPHPSYALATC